MTTLNPIPTWRQTAPAGVSLSAAQNRDQGPRTKDQGVGNNDLPIGLTTDLSRMLRPQAAYRWLLPSLAAITPQYIEMTLRGALAGNHVQAWELFDLMIDTDPEILACITELVEGVLKKKLIIEPYHDEDEQPTPEAVERQKVVSAALRRMRPDPAADENDLKGTIRDLLFAKYHGQVCLEVDWSAGFGSDALNIVTTPLGDITAPRATFWVHPVCYAWDMGGRLGLRTELGALRQTTQASLKAGKGVSGNVWNTTSYQPRPSAIDEFPEHKFLIGIGKAKAGTALAGSQLRVLAWWWCASNFCGDWLLNLAQLFGIPFRKATYQSGTPEAIKEEIRQMLQNCGSAGYILTPEGAGVEFLEAGQGAGQSPQAFLFDFADKQKRKVILGQTMTGGGLQGAPQGSKAGMGVESDVKQCRIDAAGDYVCGVINLQLVRSIVCLNYGDDDCLPTVRLLEEEEGGLADAQRDQVLITAGLKIGANFIRKKYNIPEPSAGEELMAAAGAAQGGPEGVVFDPNKDIVAQRTLWRESLKKAEQDAVSQQDSGKAPAEPKADAMDAKEPDGGRFITVHGNAIFIPDGQDVSTAIAEHFSKNKGGKDSPAAPEKSILKESHESDASGKPSASAARSRATGSAPESAATVVGGGRETTPGHDDSAAVRAARVATEQARLKQWAEENGKFKGKLPPEDDRGGEHLVHHDPKTDRYFKATYNNGQNYGFGIAKNSVGKQGATPSEYLDRLATHNRLFNDDVRIERVVNTPKGLSIVTSQPRIAGTQAAESKIVDYMHGKGFEHLGQGNYIHAKEGLYIHDMHPKNVLEDTAGHIHPIDPVIQRVTPDFMSDLRRFPSLLASKSSLVDGEALSAAENVAPGISDRDLTEARQALSKSVQETLLPLLKRLDAISRVTDADTQKHLLEKFLSDFPVLEEAIRHDHTVANTLSPILGNALIASLKANRQ